MSDFNYIAGLCSEGDVDVLGDGVPGDFVLGGGEGSSEGSCGLILGGGSEYSFEENEETDDFTYVASGNLILGAGSDCNLHLYCNCEGNLECGDESGVEAGLIFIDNGGTLVLGAGSDCNLHLYCNCEGNLECGDESGIEVGLIFIDNGGTLTLGGESIIRGGFSYVTSGTLTLGAESLIRAGFSYVPSDNLEFGDESDCNLHLFCTSEGNLELGGESLYALHCYAIGDGNLILGGESLCDVDASIRHTASGTLYLASESLAGFAYSNHYHTATGELVLGGEALAQPRIRMTGSGLLYLGGAAQVVSSAFSWFPAGRLTLSGDNVISAHLTTVAAGELELEGESPSAVHLYATMEGGLTLGSNLFEPTQESYSYFIGFDSSWYILSTVEADLDFRWDVGNQALRYYQIQGKCQIPPACETTGLSVDDSNCGSGGGRFLQTVVARNLADVCTQLRLRFMAYPSKWPIESIKRFSRPVYTTDIDSEIAQGIDHDCNVLGTVSFCHIPECLIFCAGEPLVAEIGIETSIQDRFFNYEGSGELLLSGLNQANDDQGTTPEGEVTLGGESLVACSNYNYTSVNGFILAGEPEVTCSAWHYTAVGELEVYGDAPCISSAYRYTTTGGFYLEGQASASSQLEFNPYYPLLRLKGVAQGRVTRNVLTDGLLTLGDSATCKSSHYSHTGSGQLELTEETAVISSQWSYVPNSGLTTSGEYLIGLKHHPEGGLSFIGDADTGQIIKYLPVGSLLLGGEILVNESSGWSWANVGGVTLSGDVETNCINLGVLDVEPSPTAELVDIQQVYKSVDSGEELQLEADTGEVTVNSGCDPIPIRLLFSHNLNQAAILKEFLKRNNLELPKNLALTYNKFDSSWRTNMHFQGSNNDKNENWLVLFEWSCDDEVGSKALDFNVWKFSTLVVRFFRTNNGIEKTETRILYTFPTDPTCRDQNIDFAFTINTQTGEVELPDILAVSDSILTDEIGLFANSYWDRNPNLKFVITEQSLPVERKTKSIKALLPSD